MNRTFRNGEPMITEGCLPDHGGFEKVILRCILYYNTRRVLENFPYTEKILAAGIRPHASDVWNYGKTQPGPA